MATLRDYDTPTFAVTVRRSSSELQGLKLVGRWGIDPPPKTDEIYSLTARATDFTFPKIPDTSEK